MTLTIPELCLVVLIGPSGSGKSTFARRHFKPTEVLSSDYCRGLVSDDDNDQAATADAFDVLQYVAGKRLARGLLTVVDATNVQPESRAPWVELAGEHDVLPVAIVLKADDADCHARNAGRPGRDFGPHVVRQQSAQLRRSLRALPREGFRYVHVLSTPEEVDAVAIERQALWNNRKTDRGPFDIIGDVHGCAGELFGLLMKLGYQFVGQLDGEPDVLGATRVIPPAGRKAVFLGDLVDRGPDSPRVLKLVMRMVREGHALCVPGNHDVKLLRKLRGKDVKLSHGLAETLAQLAAEPPEFLAAVERFIDGLVGHYVLDGGRLVVAHAGMKQRYIGRASQRVREFALYGETTGETDEFGLPVRHDWAADYRGPATVVYGHTPVPEADWLNNTLNVDTGCAFGGKLTALRWPEREIVSVPARRVYAEPIRPFLPTGAPALSAQQASDDVLDISDVIGKRIVTTRLHHNVTIRAENAAAALEVMSRFAVDPKWLIYLPPTMSPCATSARPGLLEHPDEAFAYFRHEGVTHVVCEQKHMGSRAVVIVCKTADVARTRFGVTDGAAAAGGIVYTRTGRRFFDDPLTESALLALVRDAMTAANLWDELATDWACLDCELMPWSAKAQDLLRTQYAAVGSAARAAAAETVTQLQRATFSRDPNGTSFSRDPKGERQETPQGSASVGAAEMISALLTRQQDRLIRVDKYVNAYRHYCWPVNSVADLKLAPFHLLATEGRVHVDQDHPWHMATLARLAAPGSPIVATNHHLIDLSDGASVAAGVSWWEQLTAAGGEGMVVKPREFVVRGRKGLVQPAVKCRGPEYLRIIYGPEYDAPEHLARLRARGLGSKRSLALREFALGVESLERFARREPLRRVHECAFAVLALESEPVDPRL